MRSPLRRLAPACLLLLTLSTPACHAPVTVTTPEGQRAYTSTQLLADIQALSQTAINLNARTDKLHLTVADTTLVKNFALASIPTIDAYNSGKGTLATVLAGLNSLTSTISVDATRNPSLATALAAIRAGLAQLGVQ